jgi:hypothetical protein
MRPIQALRRSEAPKGEVHSRPDRLRCLGDRVCIVALRLVPHDQQVTVAKVPAPSLASRPMPQHEPAPIADADRGNSRSRTQLRLVVAVVAHGVSSVPIQIRQAGVEVHTQLSEKASLQLSEYFRPWSWLVHNAGVAVCAIPNPRSQPRRGRGAAIESDGVLLPGDFICQNSEQPIGVLNPARVIVDTAWGVDHDQYAKPAATSRLRRRCR